MKLGRFMSKHSNHSGAPDKESNPGIEKENQAEPLKGKSEKEPDGGENSQGDKPAPDTPDQANIKFVSENLAEPRAEAGVSLEVRIAELEAKLAEANDQYLRKAADFENYRKRMNREKQEAIDYANQSLLLDLIQTMDDFERALKAAESMAGGEFSAFYEGIAMIEKRLSSQLESKWGLKSFNSKGEPFDPSYHEAIQMEKSTEVTEPMVAEEYYKGYTLKERVVRSAKVKVLMPEPVAEP
jgi:molecular chaperone GrpE